MVTTVYHIMYEMVVESCPSSVLGQDWTQQMNWMLMSVLAFPADSRKRRPFALLVLLALLLAPGLVSAPALADPPETPEPVAGIEVTSADTAVLAGGTARVHLEAHSVLSSDLFNLAAVVVLPPGVSYSAGSAGPSDFNAVGEPRIVNWTPDAAQPQITGQVLIWDNFADLPVNAAAEIFFGVVLDDDIFPAGSVFTVDSGIYGQLDERSLVQVSVPATGAPQVNGADHGGLVETQVTVNPVEVTKSEMSNDEDEVYRGEGNTAQYQIVVTPAVSAGSENVIVVDRVPAYFQVTDCGGCLSQEYIEVEVDGSLQVFTELTWDLGLVAGTSRTLTYEAFIGLNQITAPDGTPDGAPTRPDAEGYHLANTATATGDYLGETAPGYPAEFTVFDTHDVLVLDTGVVKTVDRAQFERDGIATYTLDIRSSDFVNSSQIVLTDTLPHGLCPHLPSDFPVPDGWPTADCETGTGVVTGGELVAVTPNPDGTFSLRFEAADLGPDEDVSITYQVIMRASYQNSVPTVAGDAFSNNVELQAVTDPTPDNTVDEGTADMANGSDTSLPTGRMTLTKQVWPNPQREAISGAQQCGDQQFSTTESPVAALGDVLCFRITATAPAGVEVLNPILDDFVPPGTELVDWALAPTNTAIVTAVPGQARWLLGNTIAETGTSDRFLDAGQVAVIDILVRVTEVPETTPDLTGNLAKLRYTAGSAAGSPVVALRSSSDFTIAPPPPLGLTKLVDGLESAPTNNGMTHTYTLRVTHEGTAENRTDYPVTALQVADRLPVGIECAQVEALGALCTDDSTLGALVVWDLGSDDLADGELAPGEFTELSYQVTTPHGVFTLDAELVNVAAVTRYESLSTSGASSPSVFHPQTPGSLDIHPTEVKNAPEASDEAALHFWNADVGKDVVDTSVEEQNNNGTGSGSSLSQATIGEIVTYHYSVTIPAHTTIFNGVLRDQLPQAGGQPRLTVLGAPSLVAPSGQAVVAADAVGCTNAADEFRLCADGTLLFPSVWENTGDDPVTFTVEVDVRVTDIAQNSHNVHPANTASFSSGESAGDEPVQRASDGATFQIVEPAPTLTKVANPTQIFSGQEVSYTLNASNAQGRPPLHDVTVTDCLPLALANGLQSPLPPGLELIGPGTGFNGCAIGTMKLVWTLDAPLLAGDGSAQSLSYTVTAPEPIASGQVYTNVARLEGFSLASADDQEFARSHTANAAQTLTTEEATLAKAVDRDSAVPGETVTWTLRATLPANLAFADLTLIESIPLELGGADAFVEAYSRGDVTIICEGEADDCLSVETSPVLISDDQAGYATDVALYFGDVAQAPTDRVIEVTFSSIVQPTGDAVATHQQTLTNQARLGWNLTGEYSEDDPPAPGSTFTGNDDDTASFTVIEPLVHSSKTVSDSTVDPAQVITYTIGVWAQAAERNVPAYNVRIVDDVPEGVVPVDEAGEALGDGAQTADGGTWDSSERTITWTLDEVPVGSFGQAEQLSYQARLVAAPELDGDSLINTVAPQSWTTLPVDGKELRDGTTASATILPQFPLVNADKSILSAIPVYLDQDVSYQVSLRNEGHSTATTVSFTDTLPAGWEFVADSATVSIPGQPDPVEIAPAVGSHEGRVLLTFQNVGGDALNLVPGAEIILTYEARPVSGQAATGSQVAHTNTVEVTEVSDLAGDGGYGGGGYTGDGAEATARIHQADVSIEKTAVDASFIAGSPQGARWELVVSNGGPDPAVSVTVADTLTLPPGVTVNGVTGEGWVCAVVGSTELPGDVTEVAIECHRSLATEVLDAGQSFPAITVNVAIAADIATGTLVANAAEVSTATDDPNPDNDRDSADGVVTTAADLELTKTGPSQGTSGQDVTWLLTITNRGPSVSRASTDQPILINDTLPAGVTFQSHTFPASAGGCEVVGQEIQCEITSDLAVGQSVNFTVTGLISADTPGQQTLTNVATVTPITSDPISENNDDSHDVITAVAEALWVNKQIVAPSEDPVIPGTAITYRVELGNHGPSVARGVYLVDQLPAGLTFGEITDSSGTFQATPDEAENTVRFTLTEDVPVAGGEVTHWVEYTAIVSSDVTEDLENTVQVSSAWQANQDDASANTGEPFIQADLQVSKQVQAEAIIPGSSTATNYTLTVANLGESDAAAPISLSDTLPIGMRAAAEQPDGCEVSQNASGQDVIECVRTTPLAAGADWSLQLPVVVDANVTDQSLENGAMVSSPSYDPNPANNHTTETVDITPRASLEVTKSATEDVVIAGESATWVITVTNRGPSDAQNVQLSDALPPGLSAGAVELISGPAPVDECTGGDAVTCQWQRLAPGQTITLELTTSVASGAAADESIGADGITNTAVATSTTIDSETGEPAQDQDQDVVNVEARSQLRVSKTPSVEVVSAGESLRYDIVVTNEGPSDAAASVTVSDELPEGFTVLSTATGAGTSTWNCDTDATGVQDQVTCVLLDAAGEPASLTAGAQAPTLELFVSVSSEHAGGEVVNTVRAESPTAPEPVEGEGPVNVLTRADLGITKEPVAGRIIAGESFTWELTVTNHGPSVSRATAEDPILVRDTLPVGLTFDTDAHADTDPVSCVVTAAANAERGDVVECVITSDLAVGENVIFEIPVRIASDVRGEITNIAIVEPGLTDQPTENAEPDETTSSVEVATEAELVIAKETLTDPIIAGQSVSWLVTVTNQGPSDSWADESSPITVTDVLPDGVIFDSLTVHGLDESGDPVELDGPWNCDVRNPLTREVSCSHPAVLPAGESAEFVVTADVNPAHQGELTNSARVEPGQTPLPADPSGPQEATVTDPVETSADLLITKEIGETILAGAEGSYRIAVTNLGPSDAVGVSVTDDLPAGLQYRGVTAVGIPGGQGDPVEWTCADDADITDPDTVVTCQPQNADARIAVGQTLVFDLLVNADQELSGELENTADVTSQTPDPDAENNSSTVSGMVAELVDLRILKTAADTTVIGDELRFEIEVTNQGPSQARGIVMTDVLPEGVTVVEVLTAEAGEGLTWECTTANGDSQTVLCTLPLLDAGQTAPTITVVTQVQAAAYPELVNSASVTSASPEDEAALGDNTSQTITSVAPLSGLEIVKELEGALYAGEEARYSITVTNSGPTEDPGPITVIDELPTQLTAVRADVSAGAGQEVNSDSCRIDGQTVSCIIAELGVGESSQIDLVVLVSPDATGTVVNVAGVDSPHTAAPASDHAEGDVDTSRLPRTGLDSWALLLMAALLLAGGALVVLRRPVATPVRGRHHSGS